MTVRRGKWQSLFYGFWWPSLAPPDCHLGTPNWDRSYNVWRPQETSINNMGSLALIIVSATTHSCGRVVAKTMRCSARKINIIIYNCTHKKINSHRIWPKFGWFIKNYKQCVVVKHMLQRKKTNRSFPQASNNIALRSVWYNTTRWQSLKASDGHQNSPKSDCHLLSLYGPL